jgi:hypothetical protein
MGFGAICPKMGPFLCVISSFFHFCTNSRIWHWHPLFSTTNSKSRNEVAFGVLLGGQTKKKHPISTVLPIFFSNFGNVLGWPNDWALYMYWGLLPKNGPFFGWSFVIFWLSKHREFLISPPTSVIYEFQQLDLCDPRGVFGGRLTAGHNIDLLGSSECMPVR